MRYAHVPVKQAVISPSALSLMYPAESLPTYSREQFITDLSNEHEPRYGVCLEKGAHKVRWIHRRTAGREDRSLWEPPDQLH